MATVNFTTNLALALPTTGDLSGTWGTAVNTGISELVDQALGYQAFTATGGSDTLTIPDAATGVARSIYIQLNGTGGGTVNVPTTKTKMYFVFNNTASAITFKVTGQTGVSIPAAAKMALVSNGTDIIVAQNYFAALTLGAALPVASGGTGLTAGTSGGVLAYTASGTLASSGVLAQYGVVIGGGAGAVPTSTAVGTATHVLTSNGSGVAPTFQALPAGGVTTFTAGTTGFTPSTATSGAVTLAGTLATTNGGTGRTAYTANSVLYASSTSVIASGSGLLFDGTNLGVGVTPQTWFSTARALQIGNGISLWSSSNAIANLSQNLYLDATATYRWITANPATNFIQDTGAFKWQLAAGTPTAGGAIGSFSTYMTLDASGRLLVGTTSTTTSSSQSGEVYSTGAAGFLLTNTTAANYPLSVKNEGTSGTRALINFYEGTGGGTARANISLDGSNNFAITSANVTTFTTASAERARISTTGGFSVGTTSDPGAGAIYATGSITAFFSDKRLKTVSGKIKNALDKVAQLSGVYYTFNDTAKSYGYDSDEVQVGVLAQDVEAVLPQIVKAAPFDLDENNNSKSGEHYKTVQYEKLVPLLIEAINELQAKVKLLENR